MVEIHMFPPAALWSEDASAFSESLRGFGEKIFGSSSHFSVLLCPTHDSAFSYRDAALSISITALLGKERARISTNFQVDLPEHVIRTTFGEIFETPVDVLPRSESGQETPEAAAAREQSRQVEMPMKKSGIQDEVLDRMLAEQESRIAAKDGGKGYRPNVVRMKG